MIALSQHAVDRYHERICPDLSRDEAAARLRDVTARARKMRDRTRYGQLRYQGPDCVLIVKATEDRGLLVVTVYPDAVYQGEAVSAEWAQVLERIQVSAERELQPVSIPPPAPLRRPRHRAPRRWWLASRTRVSSTPCPPWSASSSATGPSATTTKPLSPVPAARQSATGRTARKCSATSTMRSARCERWPRS